jgi:hypothetical protein
MLFCPGMGPIGNRKYSLFAEPVGIDPFSDKNPISLSTKLEMILF